MSSESDQKGALLLISPESNQRKAKNIERYQFSKGKIYDNCEIYDPSGINIIAFCTRKKLNWYLKLNLAEQVHEDAIRLTFTPNIQRLPGGMYYMNARRENKCNGCGAVEFLRRFSVFPSGYKKLMPHSWKSKNYFDRLIFCPPCSNAANKVSLACRREIEKALDILPEYYFDKSKQELKTLASRIVSFNKYIRYKSEEDRHKNNLDVERMTQLLGHKPTNGELLEYKSCSTQTKYLNTSSPTEAISLKIIKINEIDAFANLWKQYFLVNMPLTYLPDDFFGRITSKFKDHDGICSQKSSRKRKNFE
jgi:hypothetical protein